VDGFEIYGVAGGVAVRPRWLSEQRFIKIILLKGFRNLINLKNLSIYDSGKY